MKQEELNKICNYIGHSLIGTPEGLVYLEKYDTVEEFLSAIKNEFKNSVE